MTRTALRRANDGRVLRRRLALPRYSWARGNARYEGIYQGTPITCTCPMCIRRRKWSGAPVSDKRQVAWLEAERLTP